MGNIIFARFTATVCLRRGRTQRFGKCGFYLVDKPFFDEQFDVDKNLYRSFAFDYFIRLDFKKNTVSKADRNFFHWQKKTSSEKRVDRPGQQYSDSANGD